MSAEYKQNASIHQNPFDDGSLLYGKHRSKHIHTAVHDMYMIGNLRLVLTRLDKILVKY